MNEDISKVVLKTGTLTLGITCKDGIVIAADNRQSYGADGGGVSYIAGKAKKILELNDQIIVTTAGTASDSRRAVDIIRAEIRLKELKTKEKASVKEVANLVANLQFSNIRQFSVIPAIAQFVLAGYDESGVHLFNISPDGYLEDISTYAVSGSGMMQAHTILDSEYKPSISINEGVEMAIKCIKAATRREPGVGGGFDIYTVKKGEVKQIMAKDFVEELKDKPKTN
jgi:proteasome beta subunit